MTETEPELEQAVVLAARIVARYGDIYLPLFERLEHDLHVLRTKAERLTRAIEIARTTTE